MLKTLSFAAFVVLAASCAATASELALTFSGTEFQGGPTFAVKLGDAVIGTGVVDPIPPTGQGYEFSFQLPEPFPADARDLSIQLTNDKRGGPGEDRNLFLLAARIDSTQIPLTAFQLTSKGTPVVRKLRQGHLELWSGNELASLPMPAGTVPGDVAATASDSQSTAVIAPPAADVPVRVAEATPTATTCTASAAVVGIQTVSKPLSKSQLAMLKNIVVQAKAGPCGIVLKGYATQGGSDESNKKASTARAQLVLEALKKSGLKFASEKVVGAGATNQFGSDDASNQRVSVALVAPSHN